MPSTVFPFHPLDKRADTDAERPPAWARGAQFVDEFGNVFECLLHKTPTTGVAVSILGPVGDVDAATTGYTVTTDVSQSDPKKVRGASMVALTIAETLAGYWTMVLKKGSAKEYTAGGKGLPLGDDTPADFVYARPFVPVVSYVTDGNVADGDGLAWPADDTWAPAADDAEEVIAGVALAADTSTAIAAALVRMDCPAGRTFADAT